MGQITSRVCSPALITITYTYVKVAQLSRISVAIKWYTPGSKFFPLKLGHAFMGTLMNINTKFWTWLHFWISGKIMSEKQKK